MYLHLQEKKKELLDLCMSLNWHCDCEIYISEFPFQFQHIEKIKSILDNWHNEFSPVLSCIGNIRHRGGNGASTTIFPFYPNKKKKN